MNKPPMFWPIFVVITAFVFGIPVAHAAEPEHSYFICDATPETSDVNYLLLYLYIVPGLRRGELGQETYLSIIYGDKNGHESQDTLNHTAHTKLKHDMTRSLETFTWTDKGERDGVIRQGELQIGHSQITYTAKERGKVVLEAACKSNDGGMEPEGEQ